MCLFKDIDFKEWGLRRLEHPKYSELVITLETQIRANVTVHLKAVCWQNSLLPMGRSSFVLLGPSPDWMRATHCIEDSLLSTLLVHILISFKEHTTGTSRIISSCIWAL